MYLEINLKEQESLPYRALWRAVIMQALVDLKSCGSKKTQHSHRLKALSWINLYNKDFLSVCALAEFDPKYIYAQKQRIIRENPLLQNYNI